MKAASIATQVIAAALLFLWPTLVFGQNEALPPPPIPPGLHMLPPDINFENRDLHVEWRPIAEAHYIASRDFQLVLRDLRAAIATAPRSARRNGRILLPLDQQCVLYGLVGRAGSFSRIADDQQARLFSVMMRYGSRLSVRDADSLGHQVEGFISSSWARYSSLQPLEMQIDQRLETECTARRLRAEAM